MEEQTTDKGRDIPQEGKKLKQNEKVSQGSKSNRRQEKKKVKKKNKPHKNKPPKHEKKENSSVNEK